jgi:hypothetical protein
VCREPLVSVRVPALEGASRGWDVELRQYPALTCPSGHERREAYPDFNCEWTDALCDTPDLWLKASGFWRRALRCPGCNGSTEAVAHTDTRTVAPRNRAEYIFEVVISGQFHRCVSCGHNWIRNREAAEIVEALVDALSRADFKRY